MDDLEEPSGGDGGRPLHPDAQWRLDYRRSQRQRRLAGVQADLFGAPAVEHFHRNPRPPSSEEWPLDYEVTRFQHLSPKEQVRLLAEDPHTPWARATRVRLTTDEKAAMIASAANWLWLGQRVRITSSSPSIDSSKERQVGRVGTVWRTCGPPFDDYVHVNLDLVGQERTEKVVFVELRDVEPIED